VFRVFEKWGLDAVEVGKVIPRTTLRVLQHGKVVAEIPNQALTDDAPVYERPLARWEASGAAGNAGANIELAERKRRAATSRRILEAPSRQPQHLRQALGVAAVRSHGADQHGGSAGCGRCGSDSHQESR
jgi:phosphoribosylformylglycinamidine (FGAM) synthase-like enzyme